MAFAERIRAIPAMDSSQHLRTKVCPFVIESKDVNFISSMKARAWGASWSGFSLQDEAASRGLDGDGARESSNYAWAWPHDKISLYSLVGRERRHSLIAYEGHAALLVVFAAPMQQLADLEQLAHACFDCILLFTLHRRTHITC